MYVTCECGYDSGDYESIRELKEKVNSDGGNYDEDVCPNCKKNKLLK